MADTESEIVSGEPNAQGASPPAKSDDNKPPVDPKVKAFTSQWVARIKSAKKHWEKAFAQMDECMQLAKDGATKAWVDDKNNYVVPILNRLTNQSVAQLYARNPQAQSKRKKRRMFTVWDGQLASLTEAESMLKASAQMMQPPDPNALAIMQDAQKVKQYNIMMDGMADTLTLLHDHYIGEQSAAFKAQFKAMIRRTKVCGVGYVKLCFQRILEKQPDVTAKIADATEQLMTLTRLQNEAKDADYDKEGPDAEQLKTLIADLQTQESLIVAEGPLFAFPRSKAVIIDPDCTHLKTFVGANWIAEEFEKTPDEVMEDYGVDIKGSYTEYKPSLDSARNDRWNDAAGKMDRVAAAKVWRVQNRKTGQEFTVCEGYDDYIKPPSTPVVQIPRFFDIFALVFNEIESETDLFPPSDVWLARHLQNEYNRSRQGLREHRKQNRPGYFSSKGVFDEADINTIATHASGDLMLMNVQLGPGDKIGDKIMAKPVMQILPEQYDVKEIYSDILLVTGEQQANMGPTTNTTATESSIAEQSRGVGLSDSVDDIDDLLSGLSQATGIVMFHNMSKQSVVEIVGPGAVWPESEQTRKEYAEEVLLDTKAGSMGRPNAAAELQKMQTAMPIILQMPNINPTPFGEKLCDLLDIDVEGSVVEGLPSIQAMNAMAAHPPMPGGPPGAQGAPNSPGAQGPEGAQNAPRPPGTTPGPMPGRPAPQVGGHMATGA